MSEVRTAGGAALHVEEHGAVEEPSAVQEDGFAQGDSSGGGSNANPLGTHDANALGTHDADASGTHDANTIGTHNADAPGTHDADERDAAPALHDARELEPFRTELTAYAYRMLGSAFEAEDAVQEAMIRGWRGLGRFEGRSALRSWMYRITTNVCLDMLKGRERRALPMDLGPAQKTAEVVLSEPLGEATWIQPIPDGRVLDHTADPAEAAVQRESVQLAFIALLQNLPPRQRVVLILREVLQWRAAEVAELLGTSVASVNSALQRARATLATEETTPEEAIAKATAGARAAAQPGAPTGPRAGTATNAATDPRTGSPADAQAGGKAAARAEGEAAELLRRYVEVFENYDMEGLIALLHEDATMSMPPLDLWLSGPEEIVAWMTGPGHECQGSRLVATAANGMPAFGQYRVDPKGGWAPWSLQVLQVVDGRITEMTTFLDTPTLFPYFGLPARLEEAPLNETRLDKTQVHETQPNKTQLHKTQPNKTQPDKTQLHKTQPNKTQLHETPLNETPLYKDQLDKDRLDE